MSRRRLKPLPVLTTDEEAETFVETADLADYDLSGFRPASFEFERKSTQLNMRMPKALLDAVKERAKTRGMPYTRYIRQLLERDIGGRQ